MVEVQIKNRIRRVTDKQAKILVGIGRATYLTKDVVAAPVPRETIVEVEEEVTEEPKKRGRPRKVKDEE